jgi:hypothetical protein
MNSANAPTSSAGELAMSNPRILASSAATPAAVMPAVRLRNRLVVVEFRAVKVGTTMVDSGPSTHRSALSSVAAPPATRPNCRIELCTRTIAFAGSPNTARSDWRPTSAGIGVKFSAVI